MFDLQYIGHAGWLIKNKDFKILCDPWFNPNGAYFGQWFPFPNNTHLNTAELMEDLDFIYISHVHEDHLDKWFLNQIKKDIFIFIPKFKDRTLYNTLKELSFFNIKELTSEEAINVKDIKVKIIEDEGYLDNDSCLLLEDKDTKILNLNDCHMDFAKLRNITGNIDLLLLQSSNAIWWPCSYQYPKDLQQKHGKTKRDNLLNRAIKYSKILKAKHVVPNAGPPIFLNEDTLCWNLDREGECNPFISMKGSVEHFQKKGINSSLVVPGSHIFINHEQCLSTTIHSDIETIYDNYDEYLSNYIKFLLNRVDPKEEVTGKEKEETIVKFGRQLRKIKSISQFYVKKVDFPVLFDFQELGKWILDFSKRECFFRFEDESYNYSFILDPNIVALLFRNKVIDFETYFLGCNFKCDRNPDVYNEFLFAILKFFDTPRFKISESLYASRKLMDQTFIFNHKGDEYKVQKYCPHMLADLEEAGYVEGDDFVCPLHGWRFNLKDGQCRNKKNFCLKIEKKND